VWWARHWDDQLYSMKVWFTFFFNAISHHNKDKEFPLTKSRREKWSFWEIFLFLDTLWKRPGVFMMENPVQLFFYLLTRWIFMCWTKKKEKNYMKLFFYDLTNFPFWFDARCLFRNNHNNNKKPQSNKTILPEGRCIVVCVISSFPFNVWLLAGDPH
jgi:hypothetical protein